MPAKRSCARPEDGNPLRFLWKPVLIGTGIGTTIVVSILIFAALVMTKWDIPLQLINPLASMALVAGNWAAGYFCARMTHRKGLLSGGACGTLMFAMVLASNACRFPSQGGAALVLKLVMILTSAMAGGVMGVNKQVRGRR